MVKNQDVIEGQMEKWYPEFDFRDAEVYYNDFNGMFYIHARMRKGRSQERGNGTGGKHGG